MSFVFFNIRFMVGRKKKTRNDSVYEIPSLWVPDEGGGGVELGVLTKQGALRVV